MSLNENEPIEGQTIKLYIDIIREEDIGLPTLFSAKAPRGYVDCLDKEDLEEIVRRINESETGTSVKEQLTLFD